MEIKPVRSMQPPEYPQKEDVTPEKLEASPPQRWANNTATKIALGTLALMSLGGCARTAGVPLPPEMATEETAALTTATPVVTCEPYAGVPAPAKTPVVEVTLAGDVVPPTISVAPLFIHGDGQGAFGCVMVAPPAFLSEDEALSVINGVAKDYGLTFSSGGNARFTNVLQPVTDLYGSDMPPPPDAYMTLTPDFSDTAYGICIEYVSTNDVSEWNHGEETISAGSYDVIDAAAQLSEALENATPEADQRDVVGVLYDPCARVEPEEEDVPSQASEQSRALAEEQLKAQTKDFFEWLKSQGVI